jgi:two-component system chemotaxis response regulator CheY
MEHAPLEKRSLTGGQSFTVFREFAIDGSAVYLYAMPAVLIIDDDEMALTVLQNMLQDEGYEVLTTADGPQGISIYEKKRPDVVILDVDLPNMNGLDVLTRIRGVDPDARVIVISGLVDQGLLEAALSHGALDFARKPLDYADFLVRLRTAACSN